MLFWLSFSGVLITVPSRELGCHAWISILLRLCFDRWSCLPTNDRSLGEKNTQLARLKQGLNYRHS